MTDQWTPNQFGTAAAAVTPPGSTPRYGLAYDLATAQWTSNDQFTAFARDAVSQAQQVEVQNALAQQQLSLHDIELEKARSYAENALYAEDNASIYEKTGSIFGNAISGLLGGDLAAPARNLAPVGALAAKAVGYDAPLPDDAFGEYTKAGGLLTEDEFNQFDENTRAFLLARTKGGDLLKGVLGTPGIKQGVEGLGAAYHGAVAGAMLIDARPEALGLPEGRNPFQTITDPHWWSPDNFSRAWRAAHDKSLGNVIVDSAIDPYTTEDQLNDWRKNNSLYQFSSLGVELGAGWYADPIVLGGKGVGNLARVTKNELPLNESGAAFRATTQALQNEKITVRGPVGAYGKWRAGRMTHAWDDVVDYAQKNPLAEFSQLPMFKKRAIDGQPAAFAVHYAANSGSPELLNLTERILHGDPSAFEKLNSLKADSPDAVEAFAPGMQSFIDAVDATKTRIGQLEKEVADLDRLGTKTPFYDWSIHAERDAKVKDIDEAASALEGYKGYGAWLDSLGTPEEAAAGTGKAFPLIAQVNVPAVKSWSSTARRTGAPGTRRFFMDSQYGYAHSITETPKALWIQRANTVEMHNLDSGVTSIDRQFKQFDHMFGYRNPDAHEAAVQAWHRASTSTERYEVVRNLEETHLIDAASQRFGVDRDVIQTVYSKAVSEQNRMIRAVSEGDGAVYSSAPTLGARLDNPADQGAKLLQRSEDGKTVQIELMNGKHRSTHTLPDSALAQKVKPIDPTQTPNYYTPMDTRRFYLELKRNSDLLHTLHASKGTKAAAWTMDEVDVWGQRFNNLWKPVQLFRLGWPQRVLMDEGLRALAVLGPAEFYRAHGADAKAALHNALTYPLRTSRVSRRFGVDRDLNIGQGPLAAMERQSPNPFVREREVLDAPHVPESFIPPTNPERLAVAMKHASNYSEWKRLDDKANALARENGSGPFHGPKPFHPISRAVATHEENVAAGLNDSLTFDPLTGKPVGKGFVVPLPHTTTNVRGARSVVNPGPEHWYEKYAEMLSSGGYRVVIDPDGKMMVGRWFSSQRRRQAEDFLRFVDDGKGRDLARGEDFTTRIEDDLDLEARMMSEAQAEDALREKAALANAELRAQEVAAGNAGPDYNGFDFQIDSAVSRFYRWLSKRKETGKGVMVTRSADGKVVSYRGAYEGHEGSILRALTSSDKAIDALSEGHGRALSMLRRQAVGHKTYTPPAFTPEALEAGTKANAEAVEYFQRWADMVNDQIGNSPIWKRMLRGESDEKILAWLETPAGAAVRREVMHEGRMPELWVNEHRAKLDYYLPNRQLQRLLAKGRLDPSRLRRHVHNDDLPDVFGPDLEVLDKRVGVGQFFGNIADKLWHSLGTVPIDTLSRHPFAKAMYDIKMRSLVNTTDSKWLDDAMLARFEQQARTFSLNQTKRHLWDLTDSTNFTDAVRFMAPFWGAQAEAITKWGRIVADRPETLGRFFMGQRATYNNFAVVNEDGEPVKRAPHLGEGLGGSGYDPTDRVIVKIPEFMRHGPLGKALETIGEVGVPIGSANTVLQGEMPLFPGPGPVLTVPIDKFLRATSDTNGVEYSDAAIYRWLFPIGRPKHGGWRGVAEQMMPGWGKRVASLAEGDDGVDYSNMYVSVAREMQLDNQKKGLKPPTPEEIQKQARFVWFLRIAAGLTMPVQTEFRPKHQFLIDEAHKFQKDYGQEWFDKFMDKRGTAVARYAASSSNSIVGIPPTNQGMEDWSGNKKLIAKYPKWGSAIISPDAYTDDFSSDAYYAQFQINLGPGDSRNLRDNLSAQERLSEADSRAGWYEYRKFTSALDAELSARGLTSLQQNGAEDLNALKHAYVSDLTGRNPSWRDDFDTFSNDIYSRMKELESFAFDKTFDQRPDIQGVRQYLLIRDQVAQELDRYSAETGGSRSLQAQENSALAQWFYGQVGSIVQSNPAFGEFYTRWLEGDTLEQGSGS